MCCSVTCNITSFIFSWNLEEPFTIKIYILTVKGSFPQIKVMKNESSWEWNRYQVMSVTTALARLIYYETLFLSRQPSLNPVCMFWDFSMNSESVCICRHIIVNISGSWQVLRSTGSHSPLYKKQYTSSVPRNTSHLLKLHPSSPSVFLNYLNSDRTYT